METTTETMPETGLTKILNESHLELTDAESIKQSYLPYFLELSAIKRDAVKINFENPTETDEKIAMILRKKLVKIRTGSETVKEGRKKIHMLRANVEQSAWNLIRDTCRLDEEKFMQVEKKREIEAAKKREQLKIERTEILMPYLEFITIEFIDIANMTEADFEKLLSNAKFSEQAKRDAELKAEAERVAKEKAEAEENERIRIENERLKKEAEAKENALVEERAKAAAERAAIEVKAAKEKAIAAIEARAEREESEKKLKAEREAKEKIETELKAKIEAEAKAKREAEEKAEAQLSKGDKEKMKDFIFELENLTKKYSFKSKKYISAYSVSAAYINKLITNLKSAK